MITNSPNTSDGDQHLEKKGPGSPRRWILLVVPVVIALLMIAWLLLPSGTVPPNKSVAWKIQPDQFPLGTVLQGSRVEMSLGVFSGLSPAPMPGFITRLPPPIRKLCEWGVESFRTFRARSQWRMNVRAPDFVKVDKAGIQFHSSQGPFAFVSVTLNADQPGRYNGNLVLHLKSPGYVATNIVVPVNATVLAAHVLPIRKVLVTETPFECYATGNGRDFEPLANLVSRLATKGVRVDFCRQLPSSLSGYSTILVGGNTLAGSNPVRAAQLKKFVSGGGRLILAADAFFVPTTPKANELLSSYGLEIINKDAGLRMTNVAVLADSLTSQVKQLDFWRPAPIKVTDSSQAKLLVTSEDSEGGFVAVSRSANRGEVIVLTESLWWNWIRSDPTKVENSLLLENLFSQ